MPIVVEMENGIRLLGAITDEVKATYQGALAMFDFSMSVKEYFVPVELQPGFDPAETEEGYWLH
ncbi:hypothetical protein ACFU44_00755 [Nocardia rhizosphaerihabitans]|uniref:hypothetical protein n=1 Tax=Nocardia rhizosphaerihabitans TaxID=1691570 RepID=UPI00367225FD